MARKMRSDKTRSDPCQERARELAVAAGLDPDARVERPGMRTMPAWCAFRDAARAEYLARESATVAAALPPQAAEFANAPLRGDSSGRPHRGVYARIRRAMGRRYGRGASAKAARAGPPPRARSQRRAGAS
jgi:hypothetical protein